MIYQVTHTTRYSYSREVFLEPHLLRLYPRSDPAQRLQHQELTISPTPAGVSPGLDIWGNSMAQAWFNGVHRQMTIISRCTVETLRPNPFDYFLPHNACSVPVILEKHEQVDLQSSLSRKYQPQGDGSDQVLQLSRKFFRNTDKISTDCILSLNQWIFENFQKIEREQPGIFHPEKLLNKKMGSCRDLAVLFMEVCRTAGIPARFVSGYQEGDPDIVQAELHAWAEVYLPGAGWKGFDPTHGLAVADRHIALAAAPDPQQTLPVKGNFRGTGATAELQHEVLMEVTA